MIGTIPPAGTEVGSDQPIVLIVSSGSKGQEVPLVVGQQLTDARRYLMSLGFTVAARPVDSSQPLGTVIEQDPLGGTLVSDPGRIILRVSGRPAPGVEIPDSCRPGPPRGRVPVPAAKGEDAQSTIAPGDHAATHLAADDGHVDHPVRPGCPEPRWPAQRVAGLASETAGTLPRVC